MSSWTHVVGVVRYDDLLRSPAQARQEMERIEKMYENAPSGSEGGLTFSLESRYTYERHGNTTLYGPHLCDVMFSGDLRDFDKSQWGEFEDFFRIITKSEGLDIRQAVMVLNDDGYPISDNKVFLYEEEE